MTPKKIYIDVTQAYNWKGKATGIIRVMDELSIRFQKDKRFVPIYIVWNHSKKNFVIVDFAESYAGRNKIKNGKIKNNTRKIKLKIPLSRTISKAFAKSKRVFMGGADEFIYLETEDNALYFLPHGGVWEDKNYLLHLKELKKNNYIKIAALIYDFSPVLEPQFCHPNIVETFSNYMNDSISVMDLLISISKNTTKDAIKWGSNNNLKSFPQTDLIRLGEEINESKPVRPDNKNIIPGKFIICVGTIEARKNHIGLYLAYKMAHKKGIDLPNIVIVGRRGWHADDVYNNITRDIEISNKFILLHDASDRELEWLYENALFSVYPSFYEGWGLPVAESLRNGLPCLASNASSIPEIGGGLVEYFSPYSPEQIMQKIEFYYHDTISLDKKRKIIKSKYSPTSWDETYKQLLKILNTI